MDPKKISSTVSSRTGTPDIGTPVDDGMIHRAGSGSSGSEGDMKITRTSGKRDEDQEDLDEDELYGLDGDLIGRNSGIACVPKKENGATIAKVDGRLKNQVAIAIVKEASPEGIERDGARGIREHDLSENEIGQGGRAADLSAHGQFEAVPIP